MQEGTFNSPGHLAETAGGTERGNVYAAQCPTRLLLDRIADKWTVLLLGTLAGGPMRFNALKRHIEGVSQKMLSQTLRQMERDGLVSRTVEATVPVTVIYTITPLGETLIAAFQPVIDWAETRMPQVAEAQARYDERDR
ncbi:MULTISPECIES: winged helix-turn-helix transcriptional regulator [unclassified Brevundimonas]|uniref:winged helix-turn-helix transcriptional regulator n=1 Tax=unclassified Brevundimonas TaxID=2622653 RepID=UPI0025C5A94C|nr:MULTISPECIES: helix-turn-helix domain-containing protein [unclassified Brevundimonas]